MIQPAQPTERPFHDLRISELRRASRAFFALITALLITNDSASATTSVRTTEFVGLPHFQVTTPAATWFLEKSGAGLSRILDRDGHDWLSFDSAPGSGAGGEYRGFPNAVHQQAGNYFHPRNQATEPSTIEVEHSGPDRVTISVVSSNRLWAGRYDFLPTHCIFTMTKMPADQKYWLLYEGTPGGQFDATDWWMTSAVDRPQPMSRNHVGDIPAPEWIAFGDAKLNRALFLLHFEDDSHPDRFHAMQSKMTVFGFGRSGLTKFLDYVPQSFAIGFLETTNHGEISRAMAGHLSERKSGKPPIEFQRLVIDESPPASPWIKAVGDLNGDNKPDIIIGGARGPLVWYRNPDWQKFQIAGGGYNSVGGAAADLDGDGDLDVALGGIVWFENPGLVDDPSKAAWTAHQIEKRRGHDIEAADLDNDGKVDLVMRDQSSFGSKTGNAIFLYKQMTRTSWATREIRCPHGEGIQIADLNADAKPDIVIGGRWYENSGDMIKGPWTEHVFTTEWNYEDTKVAAGDVNGDGRIDVVLAPAELKGGSHRIAWYEAPDDTTAGNWRQHIVEEPVETVIHGLAVADLDRDGMPDLVAARMHQGKSPQEVAAYLNGGGGRDWKRRIISTTGSHDIIAHDMNGDGRPDVLGANHGGPFQPVELWLNIRGEGAETKE